MRSTGESTNGAFGLIEHLLIPPGFASPYHIHHLEDEAFYVLEGEVAFVCDGKWFKAGPGAYVFGPREIPHGFKIEGTAPVRMLILCAPAGFEHFILEMSEPATDLTLLPPAVLRLDLERPLAAPPGTPAERLRALRSGFDEALQDPALLAEAEQAALAIEPMSGPAIASFIEEVYRTPPAVAAKAAHLLGRSPP